VQLVSKIFNLCGPDPPTSQTDRQTDRRHAIAIPALYTIVHRAVKTDELENTINGKRKPVVALSEFGVRRDMNETKRT